MSTEPDGAWTHQEAVVHGVRLHYVEAGTGPLVVLLHGFPEFWYSWRHQIPALAEAGYRVVAPDLRGYNLSEKPRARRTYRIEVVADDVLALIRHFGETSAAVVGHDWGGGIAWYVAMRHPSAVRRLAILNAPHPAAFARELRTRDQLRRSWYIFFFQLPILPEAAFRAGDFAALDRILRTHPVRTGAFTDEDIRRFKQALAQPGALHAAIEYYRANRMNPLRAMRRVLRIDAPTLLIWGEQDRHLSPALTRGLEAWVPNLRVERLPDASHWVAADAPERVNRLLIDFMAEA